MLKAMRHHARYFYVLFFIVILSFIFWGVGTVDKSDRTDIVAEVGKDKIYADEYWRAYDNTFRFYRDLYKEKFDEEMQKKLKLKEGVLNALIENRVLLAAAQANGIAISDEELNDAIKNEPAFMKNGVFDSEVYRNQLRLQRLTPELYESAKRQELATTRMRRMIELSVTVSEEDLARISGDDQTMKTLKDTIITNAKDRVVKSYVEGMKKDMKIKVYDEQLS